MPPPVLPSMPSVSRISDLVRLRNKIISPSIPSQQLKLISRTLNLRTGHEILAALPIGDRVMSYYPPNIDVLKMSLKNGFEGLRDEWTERLKIREERLEGRGKPVRVSVVTGVRKMDQKETKTKGKKRR